MAFARTQKLIYYLNGKLQEKCPMLTMEFGLFSEMSVRENVSFYEKNTQLPLYLLCLNIKKNGKTHCISSISCKLSRNEMEISTKTHRDYEGKKYNLLLRSAIILLAQHMRPITKVVSRAINPISVFSMVKYFNAHNADLNKYIEENDINLSKITLVDIQNFFDDKSDLGMDVEMTEEEEAALMMENEDFGNITTLIVDLNDKKTIEKTIKTFEDTLQRVGCTEGKGTKKRRKTRKLRKSRKSRS